MLDMTYHAVQNVQRNMADLLQEMARCNVYKLSCLHVPRVLRMICQFNGSYARWNALYCITMTSSIRHVHKLVIPYEVHMVIVRAYFWSCANWYNKYISCMCLYRGKMFCILSCTFVYVNGDMKHSQIIVPSISL